jgi:hypothetical protein
MKGAIDKMVSQMALNIAVVCFLPAKKRDWIFD